MQQAQSVIQVEIWSDFACPFCFIGKRRFDKALQQFEHKARVHQIYRSFELDPGAEKNQQVSIFEVLSRKYGRSIEWAHQSTQNVIEMGREDLIVFNMDKIIPTNSFDAHRISILARKKNLSLEWQEAAFAAYFTDGKDIADFNVLTDLAVQIGLDPSEVQELLSANTNIEEVRSEEAEAQNLGISGVPFFVFNRKFGVSGAQPSEVFLQALNKTFEDQAKL
jgi:predicted DsbA family dithiol-disulfide isomerase